MNEDKQHYKSKSNQNIFITGKKLYVVIYKTENSAFL